MNDPENGIREIPKILIVDDTPANIDVLSATLEREGFNIFMAPNGKVALKLIEKQKPDLVLLDIMMPDMDGYEVCRILKDGKDTQDIPVIFITGKSQVEDVVEGFRAGGQDYITKPIRQEEVLARVRTHLQINLLRRKQEQLIKELEEKNQRLVVLDNQKNGFLGMVAHDLRNPCVSIKGFSELLLSADDALPPAEQKELTEYIYNISQGMLDLVNDLLDISVIENGYVTLNPCAGDLKKLVREQAHINGILAEIKKIGIKMELEDIPPCVFDANRIGQVLSNLIGNAIKFSPPQTNIHLSLRKKGDAVEISVRDEGPGISAADQSKMFKGLQRLSARPTGGEKSTGLGLMIVKKIVDAHRGTIWVDSGVGNGSIFNFSLPL
jgi:signal transduction histidine kinase